MAKISVELSRADRALARLDGATLTLPDPDLFVYAFMRQEAVLSSQIEGTQASLEDLFEYEAAVQVMDRRSDVIEVVNYIDAMNWALEEVRRRPISLNLIRDVHARLLADGRGHARAPGEFRRNQNWIGPPGCSIEEASFVPPAVPLMERALQDLEVFINSTVDLPPLVKFALVHSQFETIHPFLDGNGRLGRLLVTLLLCSEGILSKPVLYLSLFFRAHRQAYYSALQATRDQGSIEAWVSFFLRGVTETSTSALKAARKIISLRQSLIERLPEISRSATAPLFLDDLFRHPYITARQAAQRLTTTYPTANSILRSFVHGGIVEEVTGRVRDRIFAFKPYLEVLHESVDDLTGVVDGQDLLVTGAPLTSS